MSDHSAVDEVASGAPYRVVSVNGRPVGGLDELLIDKIAVMTAALGSQEVIIHGSARRVDDRTVGIYEKSHDGTGKDVRTWSVKAVDDGLEAVARASSEMRLVRSATRAVAARRPHIAAR